MSKLSKEVVDLIKDCASIKIVTTTDENGNPHAAFKGCLTVLEDGNLAFAETLEGSQNNINLVRSLWFDKNVQLTVRGKDGKTFQIKGKPYKYSYTGPLYKKFYLAARKKRGQDSEISGVWVIVPEEVRDETYEARKKIEDELHPFFRHFDRESVLVK
ncbi:MAG: hypothetical protein PHP73_02265 [Candidatus Omnitrophica bacterium]|nr:hypothetical protein [Candidatus Omnitrophota bacterium]